MDHRYWQRESLKKPNRLTVEINDEPWKPVEGKHPGKAVCLLLGCQVFARAETAERIDYSDLLDKTPPKPKVGVAYIETKATLHHIPKNRLTILRCDRCKAEWYEIEPIRDEPPIEYSKWLEIPVRGRVVLPAEPKPEGQTTLWDELKG